jgi:hypothetical protein
VCNNVKVYQAHHLNKRKKNLMQAMMNNKNDSASCTELRKMSARSIQILKHGLASNLWKKQGWLSNLLVAEGLLDGTKQSRKELCWNYYKSQLLYIEAMQDAKNDPSFDPRRSEHLTGKDGKFVKQKNASAMPKNPLTVLYLCNAFDVPYATFKRWKADAFVTTKFVPAHKGKSKSVLTDPFWASQIYNARKMYIRHGLETWINKHPSKKNDSKAKKVSGVLKRCCTCCCCCLIICHMLHHRFSVIV